jgi:hypothetical protein
MNRILLIALLIGITVTAFAQDNRRLTDEFFYGKWSDSTTYGITLTKEKKLFVTTTIKLDERSETMDLSKISWTYKIALDKNPIEMEITCEQCDEKGLPKKRLAQIEVINSTEIYFITLDQTGRVMDRLRFTKNP